jgi:ribosomal protein S18 acetylase RimI-like enzyme
VGTCAGVVHLRRATEADARAIAEVHVRTWQHAYRGLIPAHVLDSLSVERREEFWGSEVRLLPPDRRPWLADAEGTVAGFVSVGPSQDADATSSTGEVYAIYVDPDCWDRGVGRNLLAHGERDLAAHGYTEATLWVLTSNERARRFYEAAGWTTDGTERVANIAGAELHEIRYRRQLG